MSSKDEGARNGATRRGFLQSTALNTAALTASAIGQGTQAKAASDDTRQLIELSAIEAVSLLRAGDISSEQYARALLDQCRKHRALNAFVWQDEELVLQAA